eukprot:gnl/MRDRNA2_/MRDRNA2_86574_c1_seq2.p1 gnl/MRDRNA2_/MRDRNA2_86574_c1~~gnl/MRDRNA2_/MRDRNA2_86574_c1_seq2.p1  ORF type:complete len:473 (-),score=-27.76 gnl/MRDRNA2_/MRDRNA2_86574_c1_seq2:85-1503(-)
MSNWIGLFVIIRFISPTNEIPLIELPLSSTDRQLIRILNAFIRPKQKMRYEFSIKGEPFLRSSLRAHLGGKNMVAGKMLEISFSCEVERTFKVVVRHSIDIRSRGDAILTAAFSPEGNRLCSASGNGDVHFWNLHSCSGNSRPRAHTNWVLSVKWTPDGEFCASGGLDCMIYVWKNTSIRYYSSLKGHNGWINSLAWEPCHLLYPCRRLASASRDCSIRIWDTWTALCLLTLSSHTASVRTLRWCASGYIYSGSADSTIKVWNPIDGNLTLNLTFHTHWVNTLALSTDHALLYDAFSHNVSTLNQKPCSSECKQIKVVKKLDKLTSNHPERLVSGSDDSCLYLWETSGKCFPKARMVGHSSPINEVTFSPDGNWFVSASFDRSIKLWQGLSGYFIASFLGHTAPVYRCCWSPSSDLVASCSKDGLVKIWDITKKEIAKSLSSHRGDVFVIDWSPSGSFVSGGKDGCLKLWTI